MMGVGTVGRWGWDDDVTSFDPQKAVNVNLTGWTKTLSSQFEVCSLRRSKGAN